MGLKVAVVGGGSTYTPELVEGFARRAAVLPIDEIVLLDPDTGAARDRRRARRPDPASAPGWPGRLTLTGDRSAALDGAAYTLIQLRVGGQAARLGRRDAAAAVRPHRPGDDRARRVREGPAHGAAGPRDRRGVRAARRARRLDPRLHQPGRDRHPGAARCRASRHRAVQRGDRVPAQARAALRRRRPSGSRSTTSGLNHLSWIRAVRVDGVDRLPELLEAGDEAVTLGGDFPLDGRAGAGRDPVLLPALLLRDRRRPARAARGREPGDRRDPHRARAPRPVPRPDARPQARAARAARRRVLQRGGGGAHRVAPHRRRRGPRRRRRATRGAIPNLPDDAVVEVPARIDRSGATPIPTAPLAPEMLGLVQHVKAYEPLAIEAAMSGEDAVALRALVANPLVKGDAARAPRRDHRGQPALPPPLRPHPRLMSAAERSGPASPAARSRGPIWARDPDEAPRSLACVDCIRDESRVVIGLRSD